MRDLNVLYVNASFPSNASLRVRREVENGDVPDGGLATSAEGPFQAIETLRTIVFLVSCAGI